MVRYTKLPFRLLLRNYSVDITYTPMMLAHEFIRSALARDSDFTTSPLERGATPDCRRHALVAQFASNSAEDFARAAEMVAPWVDGVDLNCGCPQSWALKERIGCALTEGEPGVVAEMVRAAKARLKAAGLGNCSVSVKIRIHRDLEQTVRWVKVVEEAGVDYVTVHGRLRTQRSSTPPNYDAIRLLKQSVNVPVVANGDAFSLTDVRRIAKITGVDGVMAARGILENPALFAGFKRTPDECVRAFVGFAVRYPIPFALVLHHVSEMSGKLGKKEKKKLMECRDMIDLIDFVEEKCGLNHDKSSVEVAEMKNG
jgi:tRNA-dihydrouridine synthase 4